jgi:hypothetical protein
VRPGVQRRPSSWNRSGESRSGRGRRERVTVQIDGLSLTLEDVPRVARGHELVAIAPAAIERMRSARAGRDRLAERKAGPREGRARKRSRRPGAPPGRCRAQERAQRGGP